MKRIMELIASGRATEKLLQIFMTTLPALVVGLLILAVYIVLVKSYQKKGNTIAGRKLRDLAPYLYLVFVSVLWLSHNGLLPEKSMDLTFSVTIVTLFYFVADFCVFLVQGFLFGRWKDKPVVSICICVAAIVVLELVQYLCRFGVLSAMQFAGMILGAVIGVAAGAAVRKKAEKTAQQSA